MRIMIIIIIIIIIIIVHVLRVISRKSGIYFGFSSIIAVVNRYIPFEKNVYV